MKKILKNKWFYFIIIFIFMLIFNSLTSYVMDDYQYMYLSDGSRRVSSLIDVYNELKLMYLSWGGRVFAHFFAYTFLMFPKWIFNIVNSLVYVGNIYLIYLIVMNKKRFFPAFGQVFLWLDGSCNYSFTLLFQLLFIYKILNIKNSKISTIILYMIISLFAGMCNENSSLSLIVLLIIYMIVNRKNMKVKVLSLISLICGYLFMFLAPGNYVRLLSRGTHSFFDNFLPKISYLLLNFWPIMIALILFIYVFYKKNKKECKRCLLFIIPCAVSFFSMIASPQLNLRSFTITFIYILLIIMIILINIKNKKGYYCILITTSILFIIVYAITLKDYYNYYSFMKNRVKQIEIAKNSNKSSVELEIFKTSTNCRIPISCELEDLTKDKKDYPYDQISKYYGINIERK